MSRPPAAVPGWLLAELGPTLGLATTLTGSPATAAALVAETLARDPSWQGLDPSTDPTPQLRTSVVQMFLRERRPAAPDADGLAALSSRARAAVVLRDSERLTTAEIATISDRPVRHVTADLTVEPGHHDAEIAELRTAAPSTHEVAGRYVVAARQLGGDAGRRRLVLAGVLVGALVVAGAVLVPTQLVGLRPPDTRGPGEWRFTHRVELADGWALEERLLTPEFEQTVIQLPTTNGDPGSCTVVLTDQLGPVSRAADTHPVQVSGHDATYVDDPELDPAVVWSYATGAFAGVSCSRLVTAESLQLQVADAVVFRAERLRLPFILDVIPDGYRLEFVAVGTVETDVAIGLAPDDPSTPSVVLTSGREQPAGRCVGRDGAARSARTVGQRPDEVCLTATRPADGSPSTEQTAQRALDAVTGHVRRADDLADPGTWFEATDLPH